MYRHNKAALSLTVPRSITSRLLAIWGLLSNRAKRHIVISTGICPCPSIRQGKQQLYYIDHPKTCLLYAVNRPISLIVKNTSNTRLLVTYPMSKSILLLSSTNIKRGFWLKRLSAIIQHTVASHHLLINKVDKPNVWSNGSSRTGLDYFNDDSVVVISHIMHTSVG